jgi:probable O-glycosylation ligase (exosortase A-associated)
VAFVALVAFTAILLLSPQAWFPILGTLRIAFVVATIAIGAHLLTQLIRARDVPPVPGEVLIAFMLVGWTVLTLPLSKWPGGSVEVLADRYLKAIAFFWLLGTLATTPRRLRVLAWTFVLGSIPLAATALENYVAGDVLSTGVRGFTRIDGYEGSSIAANPNDLALMLNLIIPIAGALVWMSRTPAPRLVAAGALLLGVAAVILTFSRAGFLTLATTAILALALLVRRRSAGAAAALLAGTLAAVPLLPDGYTDRLSTITDIEADATGSAQGRWRDTKVAAGLVVRNPVIGAGIGQDVLAMNEERGATWRRVHNVYLQYGVDLGLPGMLLFIWLHLVCFRSAHTAERRASRDPALADVGRLAVGVKLTLVAFAVAAMFHPIAYHFYFFSVAGLAVALRAATWPPSQATKARRLRLRGPSHLP